MALVSHEFWRRLEVILSSAGNLCCDHDQLAPEKHEQLLQTIQKSVRSMSGMMEELLEGRFSGKAWKEPQMGRKSAWMGGWSSGRIGNSENQISYQIANLRNRFVYSPHHVVPPTSPT